MLLRKIKIEVLSSKKVRVQSSKVEAQLPGHEYTELENLNL